MNKKTSAITKSKVEADVTQKMFELVADQIVALQKSRNQMLKVMIKQRDEIAHLQLAVLSMRAPYNARCMISGEMVEYRNGEQVDTRKSLTI